MTEFEEKLIDLLTKIHRAIEELGFNGAVTRGGFDERGIGERVVIALDSIADSIRK